jgi:hypothetical protein
MYESTLIADALNVKSEINSILEDRNFGSFNDKNIKRFYRLSEDERVKSLVKNLVKKYKLKVEKIGK